MKCEKKGERKEWKRKEKEKEKECWGSEVNGGAVAAAVGCTYTDRKTAWKDI